MQKLNRKTVFGAAAAVVCVAVALIFLLRPKHVEEILPIVGVDTVRTRNVEVYGEFPGKIRAQQFVEVRARVEGYLEKMMFAEGTRVNKDQVLFIIDPKQYKAQVDRAEALVAKNKAIALKAERDLPESSRCSSRRRQASLIWTMPSQLMRAPRLMSMSVRPISRKPVLL